MEAMGKETSTVQTLIVTLTRKQLYDMVWKISVNGISKKYDIPYWQLMKQIKSFEIPVPPSGYWTKVEYGKTVEMAQLKGDFNETVSLYKIAKESKPLSAQPTEMRVGKEEAALKTEQAQFEKIPSEKSISDDDNVANDLPKTVSQYGQMYNCYNREQLYKEVWEAPVTEVAKKYHVSDVAIHKVCKSLHIPTPPPRYWAKLRAGKDVDRVPLPKGVYPLEKKGLRTGYIPPVSETSEAALSFLTTEERKHVLAVAAQIWLPDEKERTSHCK